MTAHLLNLHSSALTWHAVYSSNAVFEEHAHLVGDSLYLASLVPLLLFLKVDIVLLD
jgi:hypothetical protein